MSAEQVAAWRALEGPALAALGEAAVVLLSLADDTAAWEDFARAVNRARPIAALWAELADPATPLGRSWDSGPET